jgi:uncharacterized repeat protein (TIGR02543 family)
VILFLNSVGGRSSWGANYFGGKMRVAKKSWKKTVARLLILAMALTGVVALGSPATASTFKSIQVQGFDQGSAKLNSTIRFRITSFVKKNPELTVLTCVGFDDTNGQGESALGKTRATAACAQALSTNPELRLSKVLGKYDQTEAGYNNRRVVLVLSAQKDPLMTTYFNHNDGSKTRAAYSAVAGNEIVLPPPTREGYQFVGWYAKKGKGALVGKGGEKFVPRKNATLWARWSTSSSSGGGGTDSRPLPLLGHIELFFNMQEYKYGFYSSRLSMPRHTENVTPSTTETTFNFGCTLGPDVYGETFYGFFSLGNSEEIIGYPDARLPEPTGLASTDPSLEFCASIYTYSYFTGFVDYGNELYVDIWTNTLDENGSVVEQFNNSNLMFELRTTTGYYTLEFVRLPPVL